MPLYLPPAPATSDAEVLAYATTPRLISMARGLALGNNTLTAGTLFVTGFTAPASFTVSNLVISSRGTAAVGTTLARLALFTVDSSGNLTTVAQCASDTTLCAATFTTYTKAFATAGGFPASYTVAKGGRYGLGALFVGSSTSPVVYGAGGAPAVPSAWLPWLAVQVSGQTDIAASYTVGSLTGSAPTFLAAT